MITAHDGSIHLLRNSEHTWTREESLAHGVSEYTIFLDLPVPEPTVSTTIARGNVLLAYIDRVTTHIKQLRGLPAGLITFARHFATGRYEEVDVGSTNRDAFGLRKFIVTTRTGKIVALDSANQGNIIWSLFLDVEVCGVWVVRESSAVRGKSPLLGVLGKRDGVFTFYQVDGLDGSVVDVEEDSMGELAIVFQSAVTDGEGRRGVVCVSKSGTVTVFPNSKEIYNNLAKLSDHYYSLKTGGGLRGYSLDYKVLPLGN
jgi:hypothetical protein